MRNQLARTMSASLLAGGMALSFSVTAAEGLYSAEALMDADVYADSGNRVGEVEDVLLGNDMAVQALVVETGEVLGMGGREIVVKKGSFTVEAVTSAPPDQVAYNVRVTASEAEMTEFDEYDNDWWERTRKQASQAWENTKAGAASAWENTQEVTSSIWDDIRESVEEAGDQIEDSTDR